MKLRWWIVGSLAIFGGGLLLLSRAIEKAKQPGFLPDDGRRHVFDEFPPDLPETELDGTECLS